MILVIFYSETQTQFQLQEDILSACNKLRADRLHVQSCSMRLILLNIDRNGTCVTVTEEQEAEEGEVDVPEDSFTVPTSITGQYCCVL